MEWNEVSLRVALELNCVCVWVGPVVRSQRTQQIQQTRQNDETSKRSNSNPDRFVYVPRFAIRNAEKL